MDRKTIVEGYTKEFIEKGFDERIARGFAEVLADEAIDIYRILGYQSPDIADGKALQSLDTPNEYRLRIPDFETDK